MTGCQLRRCNRSAEWLCLGVQATDGGTCQGRRSPNSLAKEFGPSAWTIALWIKQSARDVGDGDGGLTSRECEELRRLRRKNRQLREDREILSKGAAWFATEKAPTKRSSDS
jgi:transposase